MRDPLTLATISLVGVTCILVLITFFYMLFTAKMAKRMKEQIELQAREFKLRITPHHEPKLILSAYGGSKLELKPRVINAGFSPFRFEFVSLKFYHKDNPDKPHEEMIQVFKYIFPENEYYLEESTKFDCANFPNFPETRDVRGSVYIQYFFKFSDLLGKSYRWPEDEEKVLTLFI